MSKSEIKTCKGCRFRDYGTDTHYICLKAGNKNYAMRINRKHPACSDYIEVAK